jgi:hypothetical protein
MNRYDSLKKLYSDIEVLESAGLYKAANVLHKKFVKEAQAQGPFGGIVTQDAKNFMMELDKAFNSGQPILGVMQKAERAGLPPQELQALKNHAAKIRNQNNNQNSNSDYSTPEDNTGVQGAAYSDSESAMTKGQLFAQGLGDAATKQKRQNTTLNNSFNKIFEGLGSSIKSKKTQPILNEREENAVYKRTVDQIRSILSRKNVPDAEKLAKDYQNYFSNPQRNVAFQNQVNRIFSEFKQKSPFGSSVASQPEMSDEEGKTLTQLVNTNVQRNMQTNGNAQPNAQPTNNPSSPSNPVLNNQLFTMINNFYGNRYTPTDISQMWNDLKSDPARANSIRYKIKASRNPALLDLFEQKLK